ncbi:MAG: leucyl aminopeptidase [Methylotetracoccus sp.]|nr:leucyl aminopeptidase [Methylotetracoccus sp.]
MDYHLKLDAPERVATDCLVLGSYLDRKFPPATAAVNEVLDGGLAKTAKRDHFEGKPGEILMINALGGFEGCRCDRILLVGLGKKDELDVAKYRKAVAAAAKALRESNVRQAASCLHEASISGREDDIRWHLRQTVELFESAVYRFTRLKTDPEEKPLRLSNVSFPVHKPQKEQAETGLREGEAIAYGMTLTRDLANLPGNICTPIYLAEEAERLHKLHPKLKVDSLDEAQLEQLGMGAFLSVSKGSRQPARFIILEYHGAPAKAKPIVLVGKGLTFDAGGISIKAAANMDEMKYDMCGGAAVFGVLAAVAKLALPLNVIGLVPASENLPDGNANKPGDIVHSMAGISIEILNTDAEGRLLLCDALTYAKRYEPAVVIDLATLTGACVVALGRHPSGLMGNQDALCEALIKAGHASWDRLWQLPIWDDYQEQLKSNFADLANIGGPDGGAITAGCFLSRFAKEFSWAHIDIAGPAWKTGQDKGATGRPVPLLMQYLIDQVQ